MGWFHPPNMPWGSASTGLRVAISGRWLRRSELRIAVSIPSSKGEAVVMDEEAADCFKVVGVPRVCGGSLPAALVRSSLPIVVPDNDA